MYLEHFGLRELPFGITPDTSFAFAGQTHQEALNTLLIALDSGEGFIKITGEVGTGKTLLCRRLLATLGAGGTSDTSGTNASPGTHGTNDTSGARGAATAYLPNPYLEPRTLLLALAEELGVTLDRDADQYHLLKSLNLALLEFARQDRPVVVCLDEAQALPAESLEALRLLSNLETEKRKLLQLILFGQPELDARLADPAVRQLRQRIAFHYRLGGLQRGEMPLYLAHRLRVAGHRGQRIFRPSAARLIYRAARGTPRLINILAHKALLAAYGEGRPEVRARNVKAAVRDTEDARLPAWALW